MIAPFNPLSNIARVRVHCNWSVWKKHSPNGMKMRPVVEMSQLKWYSYSADFDYNGNLFLFQNLRQLNISYLRHLNPNVLMGLVPCFSKLVSLNLRMTLTVDQVRQRSNKRWENVKCQKHYTHTHPKYIDRYINKVHPITAHEGPEAE
jgi:hypothetical protein